jgi:hypothetical protein
MLRQDHRLMISQQVDGADHWTTIRLMDQAETRPSDSDTGDTSVSGNWRPTSDSYNDEEIKFTSDNPQYLYWEWKGNARGGDISIGSKMGRASHKAGEDEYFQVLIKLFYARRLANGTFKVASTLDEGAGKLTYNVNPHFKAGDITWTVVRYGG